MHWLGCLFAGVFLTNGIPHFVSGLLGQSFQTPFAKPRGQGLSSSTVNLLWGFANLLVGFLLASRISTVQWHDNTDVFAFAVGVLAMGLFCARHFGRFHGGRPAQPS